MVTKKKARGTAAGEYVVNQQKTSSFPDPKSKPIAIDENRGKRAFKWPINVGVTR